MLYAHTVAEMRADTGTHTIWRAKVPDARQTHVALAPAHVAPASDTKANPPMRAEVSMRLVRAIREPYPSYRQEATAPGAVRSLAR